jgi:4-amino-4-deoxy-L-arabinose transferase-like glycosyltransferase
MVLGGSVFTAITLFDRMPHILDAVSYTFQAKTFAGGDLWVPAPPVEGAFPTPFTVQRDGRWYSQYPPGTGAVLAPGYLASVPWLVEPLLAAGAVLLIALAAWRQYDRSTAVLTLLLLAMSPFLLLVAGAYLSHVPALFFASVVLVAATRYAEAPSRRWMVLLALGLGLTFLTREIVAVFYGLSVALVGFGWGLHRRGRAAVADAVVGGLILVGALGLYLGYNAALTGSPFVLPRLQFNPRDVYGFGVGVGFYGEHTVASGLVNAEEQLTSLGFYLAGWPYGFSLGVLLLPLATRRWGRWDGVHGLLVGLFVLGYVAEFYHGIVLGPRYYFEALPSLAILTARGFVSLTGAVAGWVSALGLDGGWWRARQASLLVLAVLLACNVFYFAPRQAALYAGYTGMPGAGPALGNVAEPGLVGRVPALDGALVVTEEWWYYAIYLAALNCPRLDCGAVFAYGPTLEAREALARAFPGRRWYDVLVQEGMLDAEPGAP